MIYSNIITAVKEMTRSKETDFVNIALEFNNVKTKKVSTSTGSFEIEL